MRFTIVVVVVVMIVVVVDTQIDKRQLIHIGVLPVRIGPHDINIAASRRLSVVVDGGKLVRSNA